MSGIRVRRVTTNVGAEVTGVDLARPTVEAIATIRDAVIAHGVAFVRDQRLDDAQYAAFAERFGVATVPDSGIIPALPGSTRIAEVRKDPGRARNVGGSWHTDQPYRASPAWATMLLARRLPEVGGDTVFASMAAAWDALSDGLKRTLAPLRAVHSNAAVQRRMATGRAAMPDVVHPVRLAHPVSGRPALYVSPAYAIRFDGWTEDESRPLLDYLFRHGQHPAFQCRWRWQEGSLAFWDNFQTWHFAIDDYPHGARVMHRIVVEGPTIAAG